MIGHSLLRARRRDPARPAITDVVLDIPHHRIEALIGQGGMAHVYRALDLDKGEALAVKVLREPYRSDATCVARFRREAALQATLHHPHILPVLGSGESGGVPYLLLRLIDGSSLRDVLRDHALTATEALRLLSGVAAALDHAHGRGVLHRDVKPHNVLVEEGHAWLADFGLIRLLEDPAGLTQTGGLLGTFDYLAPEVVSGGPATVASDVYALAVTAFQVLTGALPFPARTHAAVLFAHANAPRPAASRLNPALAPAVDEVLRRGMALDPAARPVSAVELVAELIEVAASPSPVHTLPQSPPIEGVARCSSREESRLSTFTPLLRARRRTRFGVLLLAPAIAIAASAALTGEDGQSHRVRLAATRTVARRPAPASPTAVGPSPGGSPSHALLTAERGGGPAASPVARRTAPRHPRAPQPPRRAGSTPRAENRAGSSQTTHARSPVSRTRAGTRPVAHRNHNRPLVAAPAHHSRVGDAWPETTGGITHTWSDPNDAGGREGPSIRSGATVLIACKLKGFPVQDGNVWWYRIAQSPWNGAFYASADAFYNDGATTGTLIGTPFQDPKIPNCSEEQ